MNINEKNAFISINIENYKLHKVRSMTFVDIYITQILVEIFGSWNTHEIC